MERRYKQCVLTLLCGCIWIIAVTSGATEEEHEVEMKLYQASVSDWDNNGRDKFAVIVAEEANTYCEGNPEACTMNDIKPERQFSESNYNETSAAKEKAYLVVKFSLTLPGHGNDVYLNKDALEVVTANSAEKLRKQTDLTIVLVEGEPQPLAPDNTLNIAISVTAIAVLIIMIITLCVMQQKCGGKKSHGDEKQYSKERVTVA